MKKQKLKNKSPIGICFYRLERARGSQGKERSFSIHKQVAALLLTLFCLLTLTACGGIYGGAYFSEVNGTVLLLREGRESQLAPAHKGLKAQDIVKTAGESSARLRPDGGKELALADHTELVFLENRKSMLLELQKGSLLVRLEKPLKADETFEVTVGGLRLSVRDSIALFVIQWQTDTQARLNVIQGRVAVTTDSGSELATLEKGQSVLLLPQASELGGEVGESDYSGLPSYLEQYVRTESGGTYGGSFSAPASDPDTEEPEGTDHASETDRSAPQRPEGPFDAPNVPKPSQPSSEGPGTAVPPPPSAGDDPNSGSDGSDASSGSGPEGAGSVPPPGATLTYEWDQEAGNFLPVLSVTWDSGRAGRIECILTDNQGKVVEETGVFEAVEGAISLTGSRLSITPPGGGVLWEQGFTLELLPYAAGEGLDDSERELRPVRLELPYLTLERGREDGSQAVIHTNIGFWFEHVHSALKVEEDDGRLRLTGELYPYAGERKPLRLDVLEK